MPGTSRARTEGCLNWVMASTRNSFAMYVCNLVHRCDFRGPLVGPSCSQRNPKLLFLFLAIDTCLQFECAEHRGVTSDPCIQDIRKIQVAEEDRMGQCLCLDIHEKGTNAVLLSQCHLDLHLLASMATHEKSLIP